MAYHLAANPEWQDRCRDESDRLGDGPVDIESLEKLESLDLVMNESMRLVTPVQWAMRRTVRDTDLLGYHIPKGTNVIAYPAMNHRLPEFWTDPMKFDPDRFAEPRNEHKKHRYAFTPFGGGAHKCIGMMFGQLEVKIDHAPAAAQVPARAGAARATSRRGTTAACRCRWTACRSSCARCADGGGRSRLAARGIDRSVGDADRRSARWRGSDQRLTATAVRHVAATRGDQPLPVAAVRRPRRRRRRRRPCDPPARTVAPRHVRAGMRRRRRRRRRDRPTRNALHPVDGRAPVAVPAVAVAFGAWALRGSAS